MSGLLSRVAGAPISWGVCEVPGWGYQMDARRVLSEMRGVGLAATELGPKGFLPEDPVGLGRLLSEYGLRLVAGFVPATLHRRDRLLQELAGVEESARTLAGAGADVLVLALSTGTEGYEQGVELSDPEWEALVEGIRRVEEVAERYGLTVALHPHYGTVVERPHQLERLVQTSDVGLCIDTGHLMVGGADPVKVTEEAAAADRVRHVHLKDVDAGLAEQVRAGELGYTEAVRRGLYRPLGAGDAGVAEVVDALDSRGYRGWFVLEQDTALEGEPEAASGPALVAAQNVAFMRELAGGR